MNLPERQKLLATFESMDDDTIALEVTREFQLADDVHDLARGFSEEAVEALNDQIMLFIGGRMLAYANEHGHLPTHLSAILTLSFDQGG